ncbi:MAG: asparagine synthase (glutamine-hydrolyzing) [Nitrospira sp.]|nr:asparagine synthase (glutamine-hydrolyzing) [Nitrospira sp.]
MCGIAGLLSIERYSNPHLIQKMTTLLRHRGPDDEGYLAYDALVGNGVPRLLGGEESVDRSGPQLLGSSSRANVYLGHRRLAILDLSPAGHQPMRYGDLWLVHNGEIYNYVELRSQLSSAGYRFVSQTDTEVILAAYHMWGEDCVRRFNGDWAFCILDTRDNTLFLSRDRFGIKPLYYWKSPTELAFASEIKALFALPFVPRGLNASRTLDYRMLSCRDHTSGTLYEDIYQLRPGHCMKIDLRTGLGRTYEYYKPQWSTELGEYQHGKAVQYANDIRELLFEAVKIRLRADVPVGTCLSGGLDSSTIVAIMSKLLKQKEPGSQVHTFTASFPELSIDETRYAEMVVSATDSLSHLVFPSREGYQEALPDILYHQDEPYGGSSIYSQWAVMQEASRHVKVILDGQGGDEVFAGYNEYRVSLLAGLFKTGRLPRLFDEVCEIVGQSTGLSDLLRKTRSFPFFLLNKEWKGRVYQLRYRGQMRMAGLSEEHVAGILPLLDGKFCANPNELLFNYITAYTLPRLLNGEDRNSMAHSIESRVPFTDFRLVDYVFAIPASYKIHNGWTKWLLRLAIKDLLPQDIVWRRDKVGFATPRWMSKEGEWEAWARQTFSPFESSLAICAHPKG